MSFLNEQGLERFWQHIIAKLGTKVDKISGKGLSTNDYTDEEKGKLTDVIETVDELRELIDGISISEELITVEDIDSICGATIHVATSDSGTF